MKNLMIKVCDNSGCRRNLERMAIERKGDLEVGAIVSVVFVDEYTRNGHQKPEVKRYMVESCEYETPYKAERGIRKIWLKKILNAGQRPGEGQSCVHSPAGGARHSAF
ncbi:MAG: hypothetical protein IIY62_00270 [Kiritimatiellae bacterium]|nr:hypothetical protein [Kiritimatiellia bacterium]